MMGDDKKPQIERFKEAARELGTDESEEQFDQILKRLAKPGDKNDSNTDAKK